MGILDKVKSAVEFATGGTKTQSYGYSADLIKSGRGIGKTSKGLKGKLGKMAGFLTGGPREQTYGYFAEHFQRDSYDRNVKREKTPYTPVGTRTSIPDGAPAQEQYGASTEQLNNIFDFMKRTQENHIRQLEVQNSFNEGKISSDNERHEELVKAIKGFVKVGGTTVTKVDETPEGGNIFDSIKDMIKSMIESAIKSVEKVIEGIKTTLIALKEMYDILKPFLGTIGRFFTSNLFMQVLGPALAVASVAAFLKLVADEKAAIEANPYDPKYKDNAYARVLRKEVGSVAQGGEMNRRMTIKQIPRTEVEDVAKSDIPDEDVKSNYGLDKSRLSKWLQDNPKEKYYQAAVAPIAGVPTTGVMAGGNPLPVAPTPLSEGVAPSTAGAARSSAESAAVDPRRLDLATPVPAAPVSEPVARVTDENRVMETERITVKGDTQSPVVVKNNTTQSIDDAPLPATATTRDTEPLASSVYQKQRWKARAY